VKDPLKETPEAPSLVITPLNASFRRHPMPMVVRTPEEIMRETRRDLYLIEFIFLGKFFSFVGRAHEFLADTDQGALPTDDENPPGRQEVLQWLAVNLPDTQWEPLGPPERSGIICGGMHGRIAIHFDENGLAKFCETWERNNRSVDPRFQLILLPYEDWMRDQPDTSNCLM
jgi:hypothetical protein